MLATSVALWVTLYLGALWITLITATVTEGADAETPRTFPWWFALGALVLFIAAALAGRSAGFFASAAITSVAIRFGIRELVWRIDTGVLPQCCAISSRASPLNGVSPVSMR